MFMLSQCKIHKFHNINFIICIICIPALIRSVKVSVTCFIKWKSNSLLGKICSKVNSMLILDGALNCQCVEWVRHLTERLWLQVYARIENGSNSWQALTAPSGQLYPWDQSSTYIKNPPFFQGMTKVSKQHKLSRYIQKHKKCKDIFYYCYSRHGTGIVCKVNSYSVVVCWRFYLKFRNYCIH